MKCPNCGKEAINVNGRFVCLDCGVELTSAGLPSEYDPSVTGHHVENHAEDLTKSTAQNPMPTEPSVSETTIPINPQPSSGPTDTPITDAYKNALAGTDQASGSYQFDQPVSPAPTPQTQSVSEIPPPPVASSENVLAGLVEEPKTPGSPEFSSVSSDSSFVPPVSEVKETEPIMSPPLASQIPEIPLPQNENITQNQPTAQENKLEADIATPEQKSEPTSFFQPSSVPIGQTQSPEVASVEPEIDAIIPGQIPLNQSQINSDSTPVPQITEPQPAIVEGWPQSPAANQNSEIPGAATPEPTLSEIQENPSSPTPPEVKESELPAETPGTPNPSEPGAVSENTLPDIENQQKKSGPAFNALPGDEPKPEPEFKLETDLPIPDQFAEKRLNYDDLSSKENRPPNIDELLKKYSGSDLEMPQPQVFKPDYPSNNFVEEINKEIPRGMPGSQNIPSADSVFGPPNQPNQNINTFNVSGPRRSRKLIVIMFAVLGATIMLGLVVYLGISFLKPKAETPTVSGQEKLMEISDLVAKQMDQNMNLSVDFNQSLDFSGAQAEKTDSMTSQEFENLKYLFIKPVTQSGSWQSDTNGNINLSSEMNGVTVKKTYISADKSTYVLSNTQNSWEKTSGQDMGVIPDFYSAQEKGGLFYMTKADQVNYVTSEQINGQDYKKYQIIPRADLLQPIIQNSNSLMSEILFDSIDVSQLQVFAWIDGQNRIYKVSATGSINVTSDLFKGPVKIDSSATYSYQDVTITKPKAS